MDFIFEEDSTWKVFGKFISLCYSEYYAWQVYFQEYFTLKEDVQ